MFASKFEIKKTFCLTTLASLIFCFISSLILNIFDESILSIKAIGRLGGLSLLMEAQSAQHIVSDECLKHKIQRHTIKFKEIEQKLATHNEQMATCEKNLDNLKRKQNDSDDSSGNKTSSAI